MKSIRRRRRRPEPLATLDGVRSVLDRLRELLPEQDLKSEKQMVSLLQSARHIERYVASDTRRGRPSRFDRELLLQVGSHLRSLLDRETQGRISVASFVDHYLRILQFPSDVVGALTRGDINLFEAEQLARLSPARLNASPAGARRARSDLLNTHVQARLSGSRLRERVAELLGQDSGPAATMVAGSEEPPTPVELEDFDPHDPTHLFYDEIKRLGFALREIRPEDLTDDLLEEYLHVSEPLWAVLTKIEKRKLPVSQQKLKI